ncbi:hypothetical protein ACIQXM_01870 [Arthrobacter sp. NPDC097144]|uniref:hypothetical protein n=1 Tax=Arthrobacter sp. NPDC097144 TaxID=3363946 RepID=UPI0038066968
MSTFQAVWPVVDSAVPLPDLYAEAAADLGRVAARHGVRLTGEPTFKIRTGKKVPGSRGAARVIVGNVPAEEITRRDYGMAHLMGTAA